MLEDFGNTLFYALVISEYYPHNFQEFSFHYRENQNSFHLTDFHLAISN